MKYEKYELRNLRSEDIFPMSKIISKIGFGELKSAFESDQVKKLAKGGEGAEAVGMMVALDVGAIILSNLPSCETEIYSFLSGLTGAKVDELKKISLSDFAELIIAVVTKEDFKDFIGVVSRLFKSEG